MAFFKYVKYTFLMIVLCLLFIPRVVDASQFSFSQSPQSYEVVAKPGATIVLPYTLTNVGDPSVMQLQIYALSIKDSQGSYEIIPHYSDNPGKIQFYLNNSRHLLREPFFMNTSEAISYEVAVGIPEHMKPGDYYFAVVGQTEQNEGFVETSTIFLQGGVGSIIYLTISPDGTYSHSGKITQFGIQSNYSITWGNVEYQIVDSFDDLPIVLSVANTGANHFQVNGTISVRPVFLGSDSRLITLNSTQILSEASKTLLSETSVGRSNTATIKAPFMGAYAAQAVVTMGSSARTDIADISYVVLPLSSFGYGILLSLLVATVLVFVKKVRNA